MEDLYILITIIIATIFIFALAMGIGWVSGKDTFFGLLSLMLICFSALPLIGIYSIWKDY